MNESAEWKADQYDFFRRVLNISFTEDAAELYWTLDEDNHIHVSVNCSDRFWWGTADSEEITPENIDLFEQAYEDAAKAEGGDPVYNDILFVARVRKMRPQGYCYRNYPPALAALFDACGPEREVGLLNPYPQFSYESPEDRARKRKGQEDAKITDQTAG